MIDQRFMYAAEKFIAARRILMAPHPNGEAASITRAFLECDLGLKELDLDALDEHGRSTVEVIRRTMDTTGLTDPYGKGLWRVKVDKIRTAKRNAFSDAVDALALSFHDRFHGIV